MSAADGNCVALFAKNNQNFYADCKTLFTKVPDDIDGSREKYHLFTFATVANFVIRIVANARTII